MIGLFCFCHVGHLTNRWSQPLAGSNRQFKLEKRRQLFIRLHDETLSVAAMRVSNPLFARWNQRLTHSPNSKQSS
jgi:hypothetical protein